MDNSFLLPNSGTFLPSPTKTLYLWVVPIYLPSTTFLQLLETTPVFSVFVWICQIWTFHINGIIQHVVNCVWLLSLIIMLSELLRVAFYGHIIFNQRNQRSSCQHPLDHRKAREFQKNIYFCFIDFAKAFNCVDHNKLWNILKETGIPDHLTCLLRNLNAEQEVIVRTGHGSTDWFQIGKGVRQGCILSPCLFSLHAEYTIWNAGLDDSQGRIKIAGRNINKQPQICRKWRGIKEPLEGERGEWKSWLETQHYKN